MAVHAHPDDESSKGAATYAKYAAEGARVVVVSCTGGELGDILNAAVEATPRAHWDLTGLRRAEMDAARDVLGVQHRWLGYRDSGLPPEGELAAPLGFASVPVAISAEPLARLIRAEKPQVVVTYDEAGGYPHPDHVRTHEVTIRAIEAAAEPSYHPEHGAPWSVSKLYFERVFNRERTEAVFLEGRYQGRTDVEHLAEWLDRSAGSQRATTHIPVGDYLETRDRALGAHASQVGAEHAPFFFWPNDVQRVAWPFEDFERVWSIVDSATPEDDLFAGLR